MPILTHLLAADGCDRLLDWEERLGQDPLAWKDLACNLALASHEIVPIHPGKRWRDPLPVPEKPGEPGIEVALALYGGDILEQQDHRKLRNHLACCRHSTWGAKVLVVASTDLQLNTGLVEERGDSIRRWIKTAVEGRALDLVQESYDFQDPAVEVDGPALRRAFDRSIKRDEVVRKLASHGPWRAAMLRAKPMLRGLLDKLALPRDNDPQSNEPILVVVDRPEDQTEHVRPFLRQRRADLTYVATLRVPVTEELTAFCERSGLVLPVTRLWGELELCFLLERLRQLGRVSGPGSRAPGSPRPAVLLTSAFDPAEEPAQVHRAVEDVGSFLGGLPLDVRHEVDPQVTIDRLREMLDHLPDPLIWVHMGHGDGEKGLTDADSRNIAPSHWAKAFQSRSRRLALALLLCCESSPTAKELRSSGAADFAIGFETGVDSPHCRAFASKLVAAAFTSANMDDAIKTAYRQGRSALKSEASEAEPRIYPESL